MIITKLIGGIGNQMFQYAAARRLTHIHHTPLKLDITSYESYKLRKFELDKFNISAQIATEKEIEKFIKIPKNIFEKIVFNLIPSVQKRSRFYYEEKFYHFDSKVLTLPDNIYLSGYWQSEKYFKGIQKIIRKDFTFKYAPDRINCEILKRIKANNSVGIHIRRGDFITNKETHAYHGVCPLSYYQNAASFIAKKIKNPLFFLFSDDKKWAKNNFKIKFPNILVDYNNDEKAYEDLRLLQNCKHQIISNSSFGWWGTWLNETKGKIVIAPKVWFADESINTEDLIPPSWIRI